LAIVLKSKIAGDIRQQAKERVPAAVLRAADAMAPHFNATVDGFGERLSAFVTAAGNTLYRGISEVLDQAVAERQHGAAELGPRRAEVEILAVEAGAIADRMATLRASLWQDQAGGDRPDEGWHVAVGAHRAAPGRPGQRPPARRVPHVAADRRGRAGRRASRGRRRVARGPGGRTPGTRRRAGALRRRAPRIRSGP